MKTVLKDAVAALLENRLDQHGRFDELDEDKVAEALAEHIVSRDQFDPMPISAIAAGVADAIDEVDNATFDAAFDSLQEAVDQQIQSRAKSIALDMIRELAAKAAREVAAAH